MLYVGSTRVGLFEREYARIRKHDHVSSSRACCELVVLCENVFEFVHQLFWLLEVRTRKCGLLVTPEPPLVLTDCLGNKNPYIHHLRYVLGSMTAAMTVSC